MRVYEDECMNCTARGLRCIGPHCPRRSVPYDICDSCNEVIDRINLYNGMELCSDCFDRYMEVAE